MGFEVKLSSSQRTFLLLRTALCWLRKLPEFVDQPTGANSAVYLVYKQILRMVDPKTIFKRKINEKFEKHIHTKN